MVWWINLFNFRDEIDGLAAAQTLFRLLATSTLLVGSRTGFLGDPTLVWMLCVAGTEGGLLILDWAPAKIFMGDVGSIYLSFMLLSFSLLSMGYELQPVSIGLAMWTILGATLTTDATITVMTRMLTIKRLNQTHRTPVYQRLTRRFGEHCSVICINAAINFLGSSRCSALHAQALIGSGSAGVCVVDRCGCNTGRWQGRHTTPGLTCLSFFLNS